MKIFLVAGHGGRDPGAVSKWAKEAVEAQRIVNEVGMFLRNAELGEYKLIVLKGGKTLEEKVEYINNRSLNPINDRCFEVHLNAFKEAGANGTETYYGHLPTARKVHEAVVAELGLRDRGVKDGLRFMFNRETRPMSALLELGFITNRGDYDRIRANGVRAVARAVLASVGLPWPMIEKPKEPRGALSKAQMKIILAVIKMLESVVTMLRKMIEK